MKFWTGPKTCAVCGESIPEDALRCSCQPMPEAPRDTEARPKNAIDCTHCHGRGWGSRSELASAHQPEVEVKWHDCEQCNGRGWLDEGDPPVVHD